MEDATKKQIQEKLAEYVNKRKSQAKSAKQLGVSEGILINIKYDKWQSISDEMWRKIASGISYKPGNDWQHVDTQSTIELQLFFDFAKKGAETLAVTAPAGTGKTHTAKEYANTNVTAYHLNCSEYLNRKSFLLELMERMGLQDTGNVHYIVNSIVNHLIKQEHPLIILDEADKLTDQVLYFFITLYNMLEGKCGLVMLGTEVLANRINRGVRLQKKGYSEIFSRIGRKFIETQTPTKADVIALCEANGIIDKNQCVGIFNEAEGDMRRVKRAVKKAVTV